MRHLHAQAVGEHAQRMLARAVPAAQRPGHPPRPTTRSRSGPHHVDASAGGRDDRSARRPREVYLQQVPRRLITDVLERPGLRHSGVVHHRPHAATRHPGDLFHRLDTGRRLHPPPPVRSDRPRAPAAATRPSSFCWLRAVPITSTPAPANRNTVATPMPPVASVTSTLRRTGRPTEVSTAAPAPLVCAIERVAPGARSHGRTAARPHGRTVSNEPKKAQVWPLANRLRLNRLWHPNGSPGRSSLCHAGGTVGDVYFSARGGSLRTGTRRAEAWSARGWRPKESRQFAAAHRRPGVGAQSPKPSTTADWPRRPPAPHRGCAASIRLGFDDVESGDDHGTTAREHRSSTGRRLPPCHRAARWCGRSGPGCY
jgi:hypothetical protein